MTHECNSCGGVFPLEEFRFRRREGRTWHEWKCRACRRKYDTHQKRERRKVPEVHEAYNTYMRNYMRGYKK